MTAVGAMNTDTQRYCFEIQAGSAWKEKERNIRAKIIGEGGVDRSKNKPF